MRFSLSLVVILWHEVRSDDDGVNDLLVDRFATCMTENNKLENRNNFLESLSDALLPPVDGKPVKCNKKCRNVKQLCLQAVYDFYKVYFNYTLATIIRWNFGEFRTLNLK